MSEDINKIINIGKGKQVIPGVQGRIPVGLPPNVQNFPDIKCVACGCDEFIPVIKMKYMSSIASPNGRDGIVNLTTNRCRKCDKIFLIDEWKRADQAKPINKEEKDNNNVE